MRTVHMLRLAAQASRDLCVARPWANMWAIPPAPQRFVSKEQLHLFAWQKCHGNKMVHKPSALWRCSWLSSACPSLHAETALPCRAHWEVSTRVQSPSVPKMTDAYSVWSFNTLFGGAFTDCYSQPAENTKRVYSWVPAVLEFFLTKHAFFFPPSTAS